jgi:hypothetical protein
VSGSNSVYFSAGWVRLNWLVRQDKAVKPVTGWKVINVYHLLICAGLPKAAVPRRGSRQVLAEHLSLSELTVR